MLSASLQPSLRIARRRDVQSIDPPSRRECSAAVLRFAASLVVPAPRVQGKGSPPSSHRSPIYLFASSLEESIERFDVLAVDAGEVFANRCGTFWVCPHQLDDVAFVTATAGGKFQLHQCRQMDVAEHKSGRTHDVGIRNRGRGQLVRCAWPFAFRENINLNVCLLVPKLGPTTFGLRQNLEPGNRRGPEKRVDSFLRQRDVDILRHAGEVTVMPDGPSSSHDRFALQRSRANDRWPGPLARSGLGVPAA